jgi:hypothetical protein
VWQEEVRKFGERDAQAGDELSGLQGVLLVNWLVPARVEEELSKARTACANAKIAISQRKPDRALEFVGTAGKNLAESLRNQGLTWEHKANGLLKQFANAALGIPETVRVTFARAIEQSPPQLDRIKNEEIAPSPTAMQRALEDLQTQLSDLNATLASLADLLKKEWGAIEKVWRPKAAQLPHKELLQQLSVQFLELASDVGGAGKDPAPLNDGLAARLSVLQDGWKAAILGQIPSDHAEKPKIEAEIDKRDFQLAVLAVIAVVCHLQLPWGDTQFDSIAPAWSPTSPLRRNPQIITIFGVSAPPSDDSLPRVRILRVLRWAQVLQAGVVCAFAALWSFTSYKETWDGTWPGLLAPMLGAFLLDISVDGLKTQIKEQKA